MYDQNSGGRDCRADGVYYPRFGGDLGSERHWEVEDVQRLLFGSLGATQPQSSAAVVRLRPENNHAHQVQILFAQAG